jgi:NADPH2:quinone reductase
MRAAVVHRQGEPEELTLGEWAAEVPGSNEVLIDVAAIGVNYHDIYERSGLYPREVPYVPGLECAGTVAAIGSEVTGIAVGSLVVTMNASPGSYAEKVVAPAERVLLVPDGVSAEQAAAVLLHGLTVHYLTQESYTTRPGETALVHAAAGGVGQLLTQMLTLQGARVIGTVSSAAKEEAARAAGAQEVIRYTEVDFAPEVGKLTGGGGVDVVFDGVGQATFKGSLASLRPRGTLVLYGQPSGVVPPMDMTVGWPGSIKMTVPSIPDFIATSEEFATRGKEVLSWVSSGNVKVPIGRTYPLADAANAHADLQQRRSTGKLLLTP